MGRAPCCDKANVKRGPWSPEEDAVLKNYLERHGNGGNWIALPLKAGLRRCGKSCRLRWLNYLRPNINHGRFTEEEDNIICSLYFKMGSRWSVIASQLPGRTDNDVKNHWNTKLKKKLLAKKFTINTNSPSINALPPSANFFFFGSTFQQHPTSAAPNPETYNCDFPSSRTQWCDSSPASLTDHDLVTNSSGLITPEPVHNGHDFSLIMPKVTTLDYAASPSSSTISHSISRSHQEVSSSVSASSMNEGYLPLLPGGAGAGVIDLGYGFPEQDLQKINEMWLQEKNIEVAKSISSLNSATATSSYGEEH